MLEKDPRRRLRVGLFTAALVILLGAFILALGSKQGLFIRHVRYHTRFLHVGGLVPGAAVWLNGVVVGSVEDVTLSANPDVPQIDVEFRIDARMRERIRADSRVRIRTLGLLGDRYLEVTSGSPQSPILEPGGEIPSVEPTDVAAVLSRGGDVVTNVLAISVSLRAILERIERGEGVLGELTVNAESGKRVALTLASVLEQSDAILRQVREGKGTLGRLVYDPKLGTQLVDDLSGMTHAGRRVTEALARDLDRDDSMLAEVLRDPQGRAKLQSALDNIGTAAAAAAVSGKDLSEGKGTLGRLLNDRAYAQGFLDDLAGLTRSLRDVADKLDRGQGSAGKLINDPTLVEDLENVVRGVKQSRLLTWFLRNRRAAGEEAVAKAKATPTS